MPDPDYASFPEGLPEPLDDGAAAHLPGRPVPDLVLPATDGRQVTLSGVGEPRAIVYLYPMTGTPGVPLPAGWDQIPGARGCTPESCGFRDHHAELRDLGADVYGLSSQSTASQREAAERLGLTFPLLSDERLMLAEALGVPTFTVEGLELFRRLTLVINAGRVEHVFYPVFPPNEHAQQTVTWLRTHPLAGQGRS